MRYLLTLVFTLLGSHAYAGLAINGKLADLQHLPAQSIEAKVELFTGDSDFTTYGGRFNLKYTEDLLLTATIAAVSADSDDGTLLGIGGQYVVDGVLSTMKLATFGSYQQLSSDFDSNLVTIGAVASSHEPIGAKRNIFWYGNIFLLRSSGGSNSDTDIGFGGGLVKPSPSGEWFGGIDIIDDPVLGFGFRYFLK